jgi:two-component system, chemotaxis family, chemotaxis protein CheV
MKTSSLRRQHSDNQDNRLEMLLFHLGGQQRFGINVLKVQEIIPCPALTKVPNRHPAVCGVATLRGEAMAVVDLSLALGLGGIDCQGSIIITEFNRHKQGFLVQKVDRIVTKQWQDVLPPPKGLGGGYASGVTRMDDQLVQIIDVERVMGEVMDDSDMEAADALPTHEANGLVLVVDDSSMARNQTARTLRGMGIPFVMAVDGREALEVLNEHNAQDSDPEQRIQMVISDIEMPELDGYSLTTEIRKHPAFSDLYVLLHTSLNGAINIERAQLVGADKVLSKFVPDELAKEVVRGLESINQAA